MISCTSISHKDENKIMIKESIEKSLETIGIVANYSLSENNTMLMIQLHYLENYQITNESNYHILGYLLYDLDTLVTNRNILFSYTLEGLTGETKVYFDSTHINETVMNFKKNPLYLKIIPYIFNEVLADEMVWFDCTIEDINEHFPDSLFGYKGAFLDLVYLYSLNSCNDSSFVHKQMHLFDYAVNNPKAPVRPDVIDQIITKSTLYCDSLKDN